MFFRKLFGTKDLSYYLSKGDACLSDGRFADARLAFEDAMEKVPSGADGDETRRTVRSRLTEAGNGLASLNIAEAGACLNQGNIDKAREYLEISLQLAEDGALREKAEQLMKELASPSVPVSAKKAHGHHGCSSCHSSSSHDLPDTAHESLSEEDRFHLILHTLPGDLPDRYARMGNKFAYGYLALHDGDHQRAYTTFAELVASGEQSDILLYELAALTFRSGNLNEAERLFRASRELNTLNPLACLGLAQLLIYQKRYDEALVELKAMVEGGILAGEAAVMIGDVMVLRGEEDAAIDHFAGLLDNKALQKGVAERLVPILAGRGREKEAQFLVKTYLKGCC